MSLKDAHGGKAWSELDKPLRMREPAAIAKAEKKYAKEMEFYCFLQFEFFRQWTKLKAYANDNGIEIIGDVPIYCALDSADVWCEPELFLLDDDRVPTDQPACVASVRLEYASLPPNTTSLYNLTKNRVEQSA